MLIRVTVARSFSYCQASLKSFMKTAVANQIGYDIGKKFMYG